MGEIWLDQRTEFERFLTDRAKERAEAKYLRVQFVED
jgi:hypothetical protein